MTAFGDLDTAVRAVDAGAFDYLVKPFDLDRVSQVTQRAVERHEPIPARDGPRTQPADELVGGSPPMQSVFRQIALAAPTELPVLITGQTGTGKELAARAIHAHSRRRDRPFVAVNLAALSPALSAFRICHCGLSVSRRPVSYSHGPNTPDSRTERISAPHNSASRAQNRSPANFVIG